jgi:hypothetical protein
VDCVNVVLRVNDVFEENGPKILRRYTARYTQITTRQRKVPWAEWGFFITTYEYSESSHNLEDVNMLHPRRKKKGHV